MLADIHETRRVHAITGNKWTTIRGEYSQAAEHVFAL